MFKMRKIVLIGVLIISLGTYVSLAAEGQVPSGWAKEEVQKAQVVGAVPEVLEGHYQTAIKRYEYVLLALEILESKSDEVKIIKKYPFEDVVGHPFEAEIIKAYNAHLINGYTDGTFKADNYISREEIATLVVNLVKQLDQESIISQIEEYTYSDEEIIGTWARKNIDYCYAKGIMKGIGRDSHYKDILNPKGQATVEQAIIMMYRLGNNEHVFKYNYGPIQVWGNIGQQTEPVASNNLNKFAKIFGGSIVDKIIGFEKSKDIKVGILEKKHLQLKHTDGSTLELSKADNQVRVELKLEDYNNQTMVTMYKQLVDMYYSKQDLDSLLDEAIGQYKQGNLWEITKEMNGFVEMNIYLETNNLGNKEKDNYYFVMTKNH